MHEAVYTKIIEGRGESSPGRAVAYVQKRVAELHPAYFALVMATGIVSIDCHLLGLKQVAYCLFWINTAAYLILWCLYIIRACLFTSQFAQDWFSHKRAFGFFTMIAATNVLGSQFVLLANNFALAQALWWFGLALWIICTYSVFVFLIVKQDKPLLEEGINGGWLVAVVATQSTSVLGCLVKPELLGDSTALFILSFWLFGGMLYIWLISLIFYRYMFFRFQASDLIPPYWINMGAMAITTLAGAEIIRVFKGSALVSGMLPFLNGMTTMYWATATWWIPMLLALGIWRHGIKRFKFQYDPLYWGLVFPLGMYSACSLKLGAVLQLPVMATIARLFLVLGLIAWLLTFLSMLLRPMYALILAVRQVPALSPSLVEEKDQ